MRGKVLDVFDAGWMHSSLFSHPLFFKGKFFFFFFYYFCPNFFFFMNKRVRISVIIENNYLRQPAKSARLDCDSHFQHQLDAVPLPSSPTADWTGRRRKERVAPPQFSTDSAERILWCVFFFLFVLFFTNPNNVCALPYSLTHGSGFTWRSGFLSLSLSLSLSLPFSFILWLLIIQILFWHRAQRGAAR